MCSSSSFPRAYKIGEIPWERIVFGYVNIEPSAFRAQEEALRSCGSQTRPYGLLVDLPPGSTLRWESRRLTSSEIAFPSSFIRVLHVRRKQLCCYFLDGAYLPPREVMQ